MYFQLGSIINVESQVIFDGYNGIMGSLVLEYGPVVLLKWLQPLASTDSLERSFTGLTSGTKAQKVNMLGGGVGKPLDFIVLPSVMKLPTMTW